VGIKHDGETVLKLVVNWPRGPDSSERGTSLLTTSALHRHATLASWPVQRLNHAIKWLLKESYIEDDEVGGSHPYEMGTLKATLEGDMAAEDLVGRVDLEPAHALNRAARKLLAHLHDLSMQIGGRTFSISADDALLKQLNLDRSTYFEAALRLVQRDLARWAVKDVCLTVTPDGVWVAEDYDALDRHLPVGDVGQKGGNVMTMPDDKKVFVIHGRNLEARKEMGIYLRALGLEPINFDDLRASLGGTPTIAEIVMAGMEQAKGVVALFTADEYAALRPDLRHGESGEAVERWQSRPNVLIEAGIAFGIDRKRVVLVKLGKVSLPSDFGGIHALSPTNDTKGHRNTLRNTLKAITGAVSDGSDWMAHGDFEAEAVVGLSGVSPRDPFAPDPLPESPGTASDPRRNAPPPTERARDKPGEEKRTAELVLRVKEPERGKTKPDPGARIYRHLEVSNTRREFPAHNVRVYLRRVAVMERGEQCELHRSDIPLYYQWEINDIDNKRPPKERTIGAPIAWDLCSIGKGAKTVHVQVRDEPWNWTPELEPNKTYVLTFEVTSNEVSSPEVRIRICWDGEWDDDPRICAEKHLKVEELLEGDH
jgi:predicted nucleotide-binding protein